ncbi:MAG: adenylate/guanylate cyclase domain-containing protein [Ramlibacter sp.]|nr:adenylate/guanylate cyclase domain-containing protein [Ramlibacter sp.]
MASSTAGDSDDEGTPSERRLAAVVFTDVVGYSSMVRADEAGALRRVAADLARMRVHSATHGGECLNSMGDGLMLAFTSTVEALSFAIEIQEEFMRRNEALVEGGRLQHRIGIHLGDVLKMPDGTLAGDGVNTASRLEGSAPPGGICISQTVHDTVKGKLAFEATFAGPKSFKNIADPIPVWYLHPRGLAATAAAGRPTTHKPAIRRRGLVVAGGVAAVAVAGGAAWWLRGAGSATPAMVDAKTIAVLPFQNMSDDKDTTYFADGMHEDLLTQLAMLGQLKVVSRTSVMEYRNTAKKVPQIGSELKVASLVEGSVRRAGNTVRVTAQLVDAKSDKHVWAANYDRDLKDIFKVQSELATEIARSLNVSLSATEEKSLARAPTANLQAYDLFLKHQALVRSSDGSMRTISTVKERVGILEKVVALDPSFALAWAKLAAEHARARGYGIDPAGDQKQLAQQAIAKALALAPDDLEVRIEQAAVKLHGQDDQQGALQIYDQVLEKVPYNVQALLGKVGVLHELSRIAEKVRVLETALSVDSRNAQALTQLAGTYASFRHYDRTIALRKQVVDMRPDDLDVRAGYEWWIYRKTGTWTAFDAWRATLPAGVEKRVGRVRNIDGERAMDRGDFDTVHRLIDLDSDDFKNSLFDPAMVEADMRVQHALVWNAAGERARAVAAAAEAIPRIEKLIKGVPGDSTLWEAKAYMHALQGQREAAFAAFDKAVNLHLSTGNLNWNAIRKRRRAWVHALLGDHDEAIAQLKRYSRLSGFYIHDERLVPQLVPLWKHPGFVALVNDPATNAPLPLDTPVAESPAR